MVVSDQLRYVIDKEALPSLYTVWILVMKLDTRHVRRYFGWKMKFALISLVLVAFLAVVYGRSQSLHASCKIEW